MNVLTDFVWWGELWDQPTTREIVLSEAVAEYLAAIGEERSA